jgi:hypothetical protein
MVLTAEDDAVIGMVGFVRLPDFHRLPMIDRHRQHTIRTPVCQETKAAKAERAASIPLLKFLGFTGYSIRHGVRMFA